jgi:hypothetical protein
MDKMRKEKSTDIAILWARIFPKYEIITTNVFPQVFVELTPLKIVIIDKAELHLTASQVSPGTIFVQSIIIKKCLHRE